MTASPRPGRLIAYVDGGSRGNPGPAGYGVAIEDEQGTRHSQLRGFLGIRSNNYAEYQGLIAALSWARARGVDDLEVRADSELMVRQMLGEYRVHSPTLKPLFEQARQLAAGLARFSIRHVPRSENREADRLANEAMDGGGSSGV